MKLNNQGSFLIEILLTVAILSISLTAILQSLISSLNAAVYTSQYSKAIILMENKLFEVLNTPSKQSISDQGNFNKPFEKYTFDVESKVLSDQETFKGVNELDLASSWTLGGKVRKLDVFTYHFNPIGDDEK